MLCLKIIIAAWVACMYFSALCALVEDDRNTKLAIHVIFPANLIYILKFIWKTCKNAIEL